MRYFPYLTTGKVLKELNRELLTRLNKPFRLTRPTYYHLEKELNLPQGQRSSGNWRVYTVEEVNLIKELILKNYNLDKRLSLVKWFRNLLQYRLGIQI